MTTRMVVMTRAVAVAGGRTATRQRNANDTVRACASAARISLQSNDAWWGKSAALREQV